MLNFILLSRLLSSMATETGALLNVHQFQVLAKERLPKMAYDFYAAGAEDEWTLQQNRVAFSRIR